MKIKVNKHKLNIHYRGSPWGSRTQQHAYCLRYAHSHHIESHLGKKQPQVKIAIASLFSQLHFNNVTSHALFTEAILLCAVRDAQCKTKESPWMIKWCCWPCLDTKTSNLRLNKNQRVTTLGKSKMTAGLNRNLRKCSGEVWGVLFWSSDSVTTSDKTQTPFYVPF